MSPNTKKAQNIGRKQLQHKLNAQDLQEDVWLEGSTLKVPEGLIFAPDKLKNDIQIIQAKPKRFLSNRKPKQNSSFS